MKKLIQYCLALLVMAGFATVATAQPCTNSFEFPSGGVTVNSSGAVTTITSCTWAGDYSPINGVVSGQSYRLTSAAYALQVTVRSGSPGGPVIATGTTPFTFTSTASGTVYVHWNLAGCATNTSCTATSVQCMTCTTNTILNDNCSGAIGIACGQTKSGTTVGSTADNAPFCVTSVGTGGGVWYKVVGTGGFIQASTCNAGTNYDSKLHVYSGSCSALTCVTANDDDINCSTGPGTPGFKSTVTWCSVQGQTYYILVNGFGSATGSFSLDVTCPTPTVVINPVGPLCSTAPSVVLTANFSGGTFSGPGVSGNAFVPSLAGPGTHTITYTVCGATGSTTITVLAPPSNDDCSGALALGCNSSATGSTRCASVDGGLTFCGTTGGSANGVWYTFTGNGGFATLSTCNTGTNYDTKLHVFTGSCGNLSCVTGNDDYFSTPFTCGVSSLRSIVQFCTNPGQTYYVLVSGFGSSNGEFQLDASCTAPLTVDAGACQTRFLGYTGPGAPDDTLYICPSVSGGSGPYTTTISPAAAYQCSNGCFAVAPAANTTYTITTVDGNGCSVSDQVTVNVVTVGGPNGPCATPGNNNKVQICHIPPGNPGNANTLCVNATAVPAHLAHGDHLGACGNPCLATNTACAASSCPGGAYTVTISGAGFLDETTWTFGGATGGPYGLGSTNSTTVSVPGGSPATFTIETQGSFNDNVANYTITCSGNIVAQGTIQGGQATSVQGICCNGLIAPKAGAQAEAATLPAGGIIAFPNPFSDVTTFRFRSATNGTASVTVFDLAGKQVASVFNGAVQAGNNYEVKFDAQGLTSGVYLYRYVNAEGRMSMGKVNLAR